MWICPAALCALTLAACQPPERVGVFHRPSIVVAFCCSELWLRQVLERKEAMDAAKKAGGRRKAAELDRWGRGSRQLAGKAPIDSIWEALQPLLPEAAARAPVNRVALDPPPGAETVGVTPHLPDALSARQSTRRVARSLRERDQRRGSAGK